MRPDEQGSVDDLLTQARRELDSEWTADRSEQVSNALALRLATDGLEENWIRRFVSACAWVTTTVGRWFSGRTEDARRWPWASEQRDGIHSNQPSRGRMVADRESRRGDD